MVCRRPLLKVNLKPLLLDPDDEKWKTSSDSGLARKALRVIRYVTSGSNTEWLEGRAGRELYDHANDPEEVNNLASSDVHQEIVTVVNQIGSICPLEKTQTRRLIF